jgi:hypothetical protein
MANRIEMPASGGRVDVTWLIASDTVPVSRVELIVNGVLRESLTVPPVGATEYWAVRIGTSSWLGLLVRSHYPDSLKIVAAHARRSRCHHHPGTDRRRPGLPGYSGHARTIWPTNGCVWS